jgi:hypothetical protein
MIRLCTFIVFLLAASSSIAAESRSWSFVQSIGGIAVGQPTKVAKRWLLPVRADVSGLQKITLKPTALNSGLSCNSVNASVEGQVISIAISTSIAGSGLNSLCPSAQLGQLKPGTYAVVYRGPDGQTTQLRNVAVGL